jgi:hypothetical protein
MRKILSWIPIIGILIYNRFKRDNYLSDWETIQDSSIFIVMMILLCLMFEYFNII